MKAQQPYRPRHEGYVSEFTYFMDGYMHGHHEVEEDQLKGWYLLWDKRVDLDEVEKERKDHVPLPPYYYPE